MCIRDSNYAAVIEKFRPGALDKGNIVDKNGKILGQHDGIINFTIGQRKGIGIAASEPLYVIKINPQNNDVIVGPKEDLECQEVYVKEVNWLGDSDFEVNRKYDFSVKLRSAHTKIPASEMCIRDSVCTAGSPLCLHWQKTVHQRQRPYLP